jgi:hypothetical protein
MHQNRGPTRRPYIRRECKCLTDNPGRGGGGGGWSTVYSLAPFQLYRLKVRVLAISGVLPGLAGREVI